MHHLNSFKCPLNEETPLLNGWLLVELINAFEKRQHEVFNASFTKLRVHMGMG